LSCIISDKQPVCDRRIAKTYVSSGCIAGFQLVGNAGDFRNLNKFYDVIKTGNNNNVCLKQT